MMTENHELRVLLAAPTRRDGEITCGLLSKQGVECTVCHRLDDVADELAAGVGAVVLTDVALHDPALDRLLAAIQAQPQWSDVPTLLLTREKIDSSTAIRSLGTLTNVTLLDRPCSTRAMVSAIQSALLARRRQYQIRDQLIEQQEADEALRQAGKRKDEFLATLAHELRNPLAAIRTGVEVAVRSQGDVQRTARVVTMIDRQSRMLVKLIDDLMDVSRIATGKVALQRERVDLRSVLEASVESGRTVFDGSRHDIRLDLPGRPVWVLGDATRLAQVVGNLVNNAGKYTPDGGKITLALLQENEAAVLRVIDNGVGISPELLEQVFEMFTQVDRTMDRARGGLGIGLSLVRRLVELHGGTVVAESAGIGEGSTFTVRLPIAELPTVPSPETGAPDAASAAQLKLLVVDDNEDVAEGLAELLAIDGHDIRVAHDGHSALREAEAFAPDVVFCDIGMPGMSGHEVAAQLRADPRYASTLLVALTGWGKEDDRKLSSQAGFDMHFTKPLSFEQIQSVLTRPR